MGPKKSTKAKTTLKKANTMMATAAAGQEFLKKAWGEDKLTRVNELMDARDKTETNADDDKATATATTTTTTTTTSSTTTDTTKATTTSKAKPKLSKARTMKGTAKEAKALLAGQVLGETRSDTKRRQAAVNAKKALQEVSKASSGRKPALKRLGTMANTAKEGKAFVERAQVKKATTGRKRTGGRQKKGSK